MSEHHAGPSHSLPHLAPVGSSSAVPYSIDPDAAAAPFTDAQVDEFREQDRWLPVCLPSTLSTSVRSRTSDWRCDHTMQRCITGDLDGWTPGGGSS